MASDASELEFGSTSDARLFFSGGARAPPRSRERVTGGCRLEDDDQRHARCIHKTIHLDTTDPSASRMTRRVHDVPPRRTLARRTRTGTGTPSVTSGDLRALYWHNWAPRVVPGGRTRARACSGRSARGRRRPRRVSCVHRRRARPASVSRSASARRVVRGRERRPRVASAGPPPPPRPAGTPTRPRRTC